ncbi:CRISPR-associated protein Cas4 [Veillonella criceti]|uniref:CRISPR-associated exonuclease Cas4 n=1 Tax=Veillonella criceti TaxID=103891 RepID=A0A380NN88_9FIRM|nr:CRISPR-associated protein Cas4 [Veillonella criceti]SUP43696.1 CRISPR-associated protein Cas4 [Veillonella criceti]
MTRDDDYLQIAGIQHFAFCRRQWALIHIEQAWADNFFTIDGSIKHENVDTGKTDEKIGNKRVLRSLPVISHALEIRGICDAVELIESDTGEYFSKYDAKYKVIPVEYKRGKSKEDLSDQLQVVAQALCLEEMLGIEITEGALFYHETRRREIVPITKAIRDYVKQMVSEMNQYYERQYTPRVKVTKRCKACSLQTICLPELNKVKSATEYMQRRLAE